MMLFFVIITGIISVIVLVIILLIFLFLITRICIAIALIKEASRLLIFQ